MHTYTLYAYRLREAALPARGGHDGRRERRDADAGGLRNNKTDSNNDDNNANNKRHT